MVSRKQKTQGGNCSMEKNMKYKTIRFSFVLYMLFFKAFRVKEAFAKSKKCLTENVFIKM